MSKPVIFTISAVWDENASGWTGQCVGASAAAGMSISAMALDLLADNNPDIHPASVYLQITALREAEPAAAA